MCYPRDVAHDSGCASLIGVGRVSLTLEQKGRAVDFQDDLRIKAVAAVLGVSVQTSRNWERAGKLLAFRHPVNGVSTLPAV